MGWLAPLLLCCFFFCNHIFVQCTLLTDHPLFNRSNYELTNAIVSDGEEEQQTKKEDYRLIAKNVTLFIPEIHFSPSNGVVEMSSINITADFLEVQSENLNFLPKNVSSIINPPTNDLGTAVVDQDDNMVLFDYPELVSSIDATMNPCENFYEFVCGGWMKEHPIDEDKTSSNQFQLINNLIEEREKAILDDRKNFHTLPPYDKMLFNLYDSCMDNSSRMEAGSNTLLSKLRILKRDFRGRMRFVTDWLIQVWPVNLFYTVNVGPDTRNTSQNILTITPNMVFLMSEKLYIEENLAPKYLPALKNYLRDVLELIYADDKDQSVFKTANKEMDIERRVKSFIEVEVEMAKLINGTDKHYDNAYADDHFHTLEEFREHFAGSVNWPRYVQKILPEEVHLSKFPKGLEGAEVRITEMELIKKFERMVRRLSSQTLADYMDWKIILSEVGHLDDRFIDAAFKLDKVLQGSKERPPLWKECKGVVVTVFPELMERVYIQRYMDMDSTREQMLAIFHNVERAFHGMLDQNGWMDPQTKAEAFVKLNKLKILVGYTETVFNESKLLKRYKEMDIRPSQPFAEIMASTSILMNRKALLHLLNPVEVEFSSLVINGFYYPIKNSIVLTGGILQGVFFDSNRPIPLNYGSMGVVLAHEITHGFDNNGRLHDQMGRVRNWWKDETATAFHREKQCFIDQYEQIKVTGADGLHVNGNMTQGENIADNGGMRAAFGALRQALKTNPLAGQRKIRGLEKYNAEQLFFINYAFSWCYNQRQEAAVFSAVFDSHSPPEARVNVVLGNLPDFAAQFKCPAGTQMNPTTRCRVW